MKPQQNINHDQLGEKASLGSPSSALYAQCQEIWCKLQNKGITCEQKIQGIKPQTFINTIFKLNSDDPIKTLSLTLKPIQPDNAKNKYLFQMDGMVELSDASVAEIHLVIEMHIDVSKKPAVTSVITSTNELHNTKRISSPPIRAEKIPFRPTEVRHEIASAVLSHNPKKYPRKLTPRKPNDSLNTPIASKVRTPLSPDAPNNNTELRKAVENWIRMMGTDRRFSQAHIAHYDDLRSLLGLVKIDLRQYFANRGNFDVFSGNSEIKDFYASCKTLLHIIYTQGISAGTPKIDSSTCNGDDSENDDSEDSEKQMSYVNPNDINAPRKIDKSYDPKPKGLFDDDDD